MSSTAVILDGIRFRAFEAGDVEPDSIVLEPEEKTEDEEEK